MTGAAVWPGIIVSTGQLQVCVPRHDLSDWQYKEPENAGAPGSFWTWVEGVFGSETFPLLGSLYLEPAVLAG